MAKWRIKRGDKIAGSVPSSKVRQLAAAGKLKQTDLLCKEGTEKWVVAGKVKGLWQSNLQTQNAAAGGKKQNPPQAALAAESKAGASTTESPKSVPEVAPPEEATSPAAEETVVPSKIPEQVITDPPAEPEPVENDAVKPAPAVYDAVSEYKETDEPYIDSEEQAYEEQTYEEPSDEAYLESDEQGRKARRKWLMPLVFGGVASLLMLGVASFMIPRQAPQNNAQQSTLTQNQQSSVREQTPRSGSNSKLLLTEEFFKPNIAEIVQYDTKKFEKNTTVAVYRKALVEKWNDDSEIYFHEKGFRNYGLKTAYRVSNGYVQLKGGENWFRFLKLDARVGEKWTPGDGEDETLDWTGKGEIELVDFKTVDSTPVAIVEFTATLGLPVPAYLVPAGFDFGFMDDSD